MSPMLFLTSETLVIIKNPSKLVVPEFTYNKPVPSNIKQDESPPNKKYVNPAKVDNSLFLYKVHNKYNP